VQDENVIIDNRFSVRLIDFGSAVVFQPGQLFATFYGTVEYCAPEVLKGTPTLVMLLNFNKFYCQYCGSGGCLSRIKDADSTLDLISQIPDPTTTTKRKEEINQLCSIFCSQKFQKMYNNFIFEQVQKKIRVS
jgi:serine/threonine protein kinase